MNDYDNTPPASSPEISVAEIWNILESVPDPEIPVLSILDLGIVREVAFLNNELLVTITPTYSGCPAMDMIRTQIRWALAERGMGQVKIIEALSPAWTTDWMTESGKDKLALYGIAPPHKRFLIPTDGVECPKCHSSHTRLVSEFGSTACKAHFQCKDCLEPFDYFKCH